MWKKTWNFHKISTFSDPKSEKIFFLRRCLSVVVGKHDNFRKNYRIGLRFGILLKVSKRKNELANQPFLNNGLLSSIENGFLKIKNSIFPPKYTKHGKSVK